MGINLGRWAASVAPLAGAVGGAFAGNPAVGYMTGGMVGDVLDPNKERREIDKANQANYEKQKEFAQMGVRWKVADARAAGIHPLAALGAPTHSFAASYQPEPPAGNNYAAMGQNLSSIMSATSTEQERELQSLQIQGAQLDNQNRFMDAQLKQQALDQGASRGNPGFPGDQNFISGQGNSGAKISERPMERTASQKGAPHSEPGAVTDVGWVKTPTGVVPVPSKDAKERTEDVMPHEWMHYYRNNVQPNWGGGPKPPSRKGYYWSWSHKDQEFQERSLKDLKNKYRGTPVRR